MQNSSQWVANSIPNNLSFLLAMKKNAPKLLRFTDTTLRDAHQSLWATRLRTADILPILDAIDAAGYYSIECWGGATFDVCLRFLREDPWERLRLIRAHTKTPLQMLLRGQNILGYKNYPDDVLKRFIELSAKNGIDIFRIFDALNDTRNLEFAIKSVKAVGAHAQGTISFTTSPVHTDAMYVRLARELEQLGADSICIKDMAGILNPSRAELLTRAITSAVSIPLQIHSHMTSGMAVASYLSAVRAGAECIDTCVSSMSGISSQPPVETLCEILSTDGFQTNLDLDAIRKINHHFSLLRPSREPVSASHEYVDSGVLRHHIPGGMISNLRSQLQQQNALDRLDEVMEELPRVREELGFPPLVTPTSQIIGIQAVLNVLRGERYAMVTNETRDYVRGLYGRPPASIKPAMVQKILGNEKQIKKRPADTLPPGLPAAAKSLPGKWIRSEEDILSYALFPEVASGFFEWRNTPANARPPIPADLEPHGSIPPSSPSSSPAAPTPTSPTDISPENTVFSPLTGTFYRRAATGQSDWGEVGKSYAPGVTVCAVEAMKLLNNISVPKKCKITKFLVAHGENVTKGQPLFTFA